MIVLLIADLHRDFSPLVELCEKIHTPQKILVIVLGDSGINYYGSAVEYAGEDEKIKRKLQDLPITFFCIHGNHEQRPENLPNYKFIEWNGGKVWVEEEFPSIMFAQDGEIYNIAGKKTLVIGGAYSVDKYRRKMEKVLGITRIMEWWEDEQPSDKIKQFVEANLEKADWKVDVVLSHTCPKKYLKHIKREAFLPGIDQSTVDTSTEKWLNTIENRLSYKYWYCGHFHIKRKVRKLQFVYDDFVDFP